MGKGWPQGWIPGFSRNGKQTEALLLSGLVLNGTVHEKGGGTRGNSGYLRGKSKVWVSNWRGLLLTGTKGEDHSRMPLPYIRHSAPRWAGLYVATFFREGDWLIVPSTRESSVYLLSTRHRAHCTLHRSRRHGIGATSLAPISRCQIGHHQGHRRSPSLLSRPIPAPLCSSVPYTYLCPPWLLVLCLAVSSHRRPPWRC